MSVRVDKRNIHQYVYYDNTEQFCEYVIRKCTHLPKSPRIAYSREMIRKVNLLSSLVRSTIKIYPNRNIELFDKRIHILSKSIEVLDEIYSLMHTMIKVFRKDFKRIGFISYFIEQYNKELNLLKGTRDSDIKRRKELM